MSGDAPVRLRLSRTKGFKLQALSLATNGLPAVNVARPSRWGNPFNIGCPAAAVWCGEPVLLLKKRAFFAADMFRWWLASEIEFTGRGALDRVRYEMLEQRRRRILSDIALLRGKNLACFCKPLMPCHADVLLELADG